MQSFRYYITLLLFTVMNGCGVLIPATDAEDEWSAVWWITGVVVIVAIAVSVRATKNANEDDDS